MCNSIVMCVYGICANASIIISIMVDSYGEDGPG